MTENINTYNLSRVFWNWAFENPELMSPNLAAIYFFAIEHCNRLGGKKKFGFPSQMTMDAVGICKYQTYIKYFNQLVELGFIELIQKSKNQYSSNVISIISAMPKNGKALDKAFIKHGAKQTQKQGQSNHESDGSIDKQVNKETISIKEIEVDESENETNQFQEKIKSDLKAIETKNQYSDKDFLENWAKCRMHYYKKPTEIKSLTAFERADLNKALQTYDRSQVNEAMIGLFSQEVISFSAMVLRPKHFLERVDTYYMAEKSKDYKLYGSKKQLAE